MRTRVALRHSSRAHGPARLSLPDKVLDELKAIGSASGAA
ncbi:hypothetical protein BN2475_570059 [Paraburkholderia ribeironis]|uniref:Uncharacterized protein n=1 Tax=Paraburkholderia ribeironis TaxID=1247936 RepID=A0A1N7SF25_9BURK|nr:hypothetical protein BN2475_570059 [Paraburkholderia ribeironis]